MATVKFHKCYGILNVDLTFIVILSLVVLFCNNVGLGRGKALLGL